MPHEPSDREVEEALADRDWWESIGNAAGMGKLIGFSFRVYASFVNGPMEGSVAKVIESLRAQLAEQKLATEEQRGNADSWYRQLEEHRHALIVAQHDLDERDAECERVGAANENYAAEVQRLREERDALMAFAQAVVKSTLWGHYIDDLDGGDVQQWALDHGVMREVEGGFDPDSHFDDSGCAERGDTWYEFTDEVEWDTDRIRVLKQARAADAERVQRIYDEAGEHADQGKLELTWVRSELNELLYLAREDGGES